MNSEAFELQKDPNVLCGEYHLSNHLFMSHSMAECTILDPDVYTTIPPHIFVLMHHPDIYLTDPLWLSSSECK